MVELELHRHELSHVTIQGGFRAVFFLRWKNDHRKGLLEA